MRRLKTGMVGPCELCVGTTENKDRVRARARDTSTCTKLLGIGFVVLAACGSPRHESSPENRLAAYLTHAGSADIATWKLGPDAFHQIIVDPFRGLYAEYAAQFDAHPPVLGPVDVRKHYASDPALSSSQVRLRWTVPAMYPAYTALGTVFVDDHGHWRSLAGLDEALLARIRALDAACADRLLLVGPPGECTDVGWVIADAGLRGDQPRFAHACQLAATACLKQ